MNFAFNETTKELQHRLQKFMEERVYPNEQRFHDEVERDRWKPAGILEELKMKARAEGLWNLFLPNHENGAGLTNLDYAPLCEIMGRATWHPRYSTARRRTPAIWKCLLATARRSRRKNG